MAMYGQLTKIVNAILKQLAVRVINGLKIKIANVILKNDAAHHILSLLYVNAIRKNTVVQAKLLKKI